MTATKHTPAPWRAVYNATSDEYAIWGTGLTPLARAAGAEYDQNNAGYPHAAANARLIAAAPELLAEYAGLLARVQMMANAMRRRGLGGWVDEWLSDGILHGAAIAKAEGAE